MSDTRLRSEIDKIKTDNSRPALIASADLRTWFAGAWSLLR
jgi:hypothetical protein